MFDAFGHSSLRQSVFAVFVLFIFAGSIVEIVGEFADGETLDSMGNDLLRLALSTVVIGFFVHEYRIQQQNLKSLEAELANARGRLVRLDSNSQALANQYRAIMQKQFDAWNLTASEQDIVLCMLKGLSFREIAALRQTREKTVRQQASSVYRKAGVASRNELTAWFFEDMLDPPPLQEAAGP